MVEAGLCRVKNAKPHVHDELLRVYMSVCSRTGSLGFAIQMAGQAGKATSGGLQPLASEHAITLFGKTWGLFGQSGYFLAGHTYDVGAMVISSLKWCSWTPPSRL